VTSRPSSCPQADFKFFLNRRTGERARRRAAELAWEGVPTSLQEVLTGIEARESPRCRPGVVAAAGGGGGHRHRLDGQVGGRRGGRDCGSDEGVEGSEMVETGDSIVFLQFLRRRGRGLSASSPSSGAPMWASPRWSGACRTAGPIVGPIPGLTRDRLDVEASWQDKSFVLQTRVASSRRPSGRTVWKACRGGSRIRRSAPIGAADVVLFVVDAIVGVTSDELALAERLRRQKAPVVLAANKVDNLAGELAAAELWGLGFGEPTPCPPSTVAGRATSWNRIVELLPDEPSRPLTADLPAIALLGRPETLASPRCSTGWWGRSGRSSTPTLARPGYVRRQP